MIDVESLREDLKNDSIGAYFGGRFEAGLIESFDIGNASDEEIIELAKERGIDLEKYKK